VEPAPDKTVAVLSPHAGYIYSGPTMGHAFARVRGKKPRRVILLGGSHRYRIPTASVYFEGSFQTPVGDFPVDADFAAKLAHSLIACPPDPHLFEHSLEVILPFIHAAMGIVPIVPVLFGFPESDWHELAGQYIASIADPDDLVVASSDLSHYLSEKEANEQDKRSIDAVLGQNCEIMAAGLMDDSLSMCGGAAVIAAMSFALARNANKWSLLDYRTSAAASGDYNRVVGYAAVSMELDT
jgi:AmmeMemoRadiSam system protein B